MNGLRPTGSIKIALIIMVAAAIGHTAIAQEAAPEPRTACEYQATAVAAPGSGSEALMTLGRVARGYDIVYFALHPADQSAGSTWAAFDTGQRLVVPIIADINETAGHRAAPGIPGHRIMAVGQMRGDAGALVIGTGAEVNAAAFPGGALIIGDAVVARLERGWSFIDVNTDRIDAIEAAGVSMPRAMIVLTRSPDGETYRLCASPVAPGAGQVATLVGGGEELRRYILAGENIYYPAPDGNVMRLNLNEGGRQEMLQNPSEMISLLMQPGSSRLSQEFARVGNDLVRATRQADPQAARIIDRVEGIFEGALPNTIIAMDGGWVRRLAQSLSLESIAAGGLADGFIVFARRPAEAGLPANLFIYRIASQDITELGPMTDAEGDPIDRVFSARFMRSWDVAILAGNEHRATFQIYSNPVMDIVAVHANEALANIAERNGETIVTARFIDSLYNYQENSDRTYDSMQLASDGRIYFGVMPHHPTLGAPLFRYDPGADELTYFGEFDAIAGTKADGIIPNMVHDRPAEMNGRLYFTGQDPFYGDHDFPGMTKENTRYPGSPIVFLDMESDEWHPVGVPIPSDHPDLAQVFGGQSIFHMAADPHRNQLYMRPGYSSGDWWVVQLGPDGKVANEARKSDIKGWPNIIHVAEDGYVYYPVLREPRDDDGPAGGPCYIVRLDPETGENMIMTSFTFNEINERDVIAPPADIRPLDFEPPLGRARQTSNTNWLRSRQEPGKILGVVSGGNIIIRYDIETREIRKLAIRPGGQGSFFTNYDRGYMFTRDRRGYPMETVILTMLNLETGESKEVGRVVDDRDRWFTQITDVSFTPAGDLVLSAQIYAAPGDPYMRRYRNPVPIDSCVWIIENPEALW